MDVDLGITRTSATDVTLRSQDGSSVVADPETMTVGKTPKSSIVRPASPVVSGELSVVITAVVEVIVPITDCVIEAGRDDILSRESNDVITD